MLQEAGGRVLDPTGGRLRSAWFTCPPQLAAAVPMPLPTLLPPPLLLPLPLSPPPVNPLTPTPPPSSLAGAPFNLMSRRVLGTNAHLAEAAAAILAQCSDAPNEPPALPPLA